jgi:hypothetical protein
MRKKNTEVEVLSEKRGLEADKNFFSKYGPNIVLGVFILYVVLLAIGTIADIFKIQSVLDWWLWRTW